MHDTHALFSDSSSTDLGGMTRRALLRGTAAGSVAALGGIPRFALPAAARQATPAAVSAATHRLSLGQMELVFLNDGMFEAPIAFFALNAPEAALAEHLASEGLAPDGTVPISIQPLLVETDGQRVLLDTGIGPLGPMPGQLPAALEAEGIAPGDIETVLISHLHADHIGGLLDASGAPAFPNARVLINAAEHDFWASEPSLDELVSPEEMKAQAVQAAVTVLAALQDAIELIAPGDEIAPGLTAVDARGHTPGHLAVEIVSDGETLLYVADAAHVPVIQLQRPGWFMVADNWPAWAVTTRQALLDRAMTEDLLVAASHFPFPGVGRVTKAEIGWDWTPAG